MSAAAVRLQAEPQQETRERAILGRSIAVDVLAHKAWRASGKKGDVRDYAQSGWVGAVSCYSRLDRSKAEYQTLAERNIRGRIQDFLRAEDVLTRQDRARVRAGIIDCPWYRVALSPRSEASLQDRTALADIKRAETRADLQQTMRRYLSQRDCVLMELLYWQGLTLTEAAREMGISLSHAHGIEKRAIETLRSVMGAA